MFPLEMDAKHCCPSPCNEREDTYHKNNQDNKRDNASEGIRGVHYIRKE